MSGKAKHKKERKLALPRFQDPRSKTRVGHIRLERKTSVAGVTPTHSLLKMIPW